MKELKIKRKIVKVGNSLMVSIPKQILEAIKKEKGDDIELKINIE